MRAGAAARALSAERLRVVALPNHDDDETIRSLRALQAEFAFLEILAVPPTAAPTWQVVWNVWERNPRAYWWHEGRYAVETRLPPKKTRQLVYALYMLDGDGALPSYIDADSVVPTDCFRSGAAGMERYDVVQHTSVAGNALQTRAASMSAMDHMTWDGSL